MVQSRSYLWSYGSGFERVAKAERKLFRRESEVASETNRKDPTSKCVYTLIIVVITDDVAETYLQCYAQVSHAGREAWWYLKKFQSDILCVAGAMVCNNF